MNTRKRMLVGLVLLLAAVGLTLLGLTTAAPAGNRSPDANLVADPGPAVVTYGQKVAYTATLENTDNSMFTQVEFSDEAPLMYVAGETEPRLATFRYASCDETLILQDKEVPSDPDVVEEITCDIGQIPAGQTAKVVVVWETPSAGSSDDPNTTADECAETTNTSNVVSPTPAPCMTNLVAWTMKEGTGNEGSAGPDTFVSNTEGVSLLLVPDPTKARGYALDECDNGASLSTAGVGPGNKLSTAVCATSVPGAAAEPFSPGLIIQIDEGVGSFNPGITQTSFICIPGPKSETNPGLCPSTPGYGNSGYEPWSFDDPDTTGVETGTFTFVIDNTQLPKGEKIDKVFHNGVLLPSNAEPNVTFEITVNNKLKITTVVVEGPTQGGWDFG